MSTWIITPDKYLHADQVQALRKTIEASMLSAKSKGRQIAVRDYTVIEVALGTGLRVSELSNLLVSEIQLGRGQNSLIVRKGKGGKTGVVQFSTRLKNIIREYLDYRQSDSSYLFYSARSDQIKVSGLQKIFKNYARKAGIDSRYSIHCLRHTYATLLYKASGYNLRLVMSQLRHSNIQTTSVYSAVINPDLEKAVEAMDSMEN
ncbi:MAG: tyrosine-type recombinase/integrase [Candidatus Marinimicrobia bacterium]|jgi:site-specific recombinase XerD|nr:tyrosine-type recombinase/integrase [Candidatus Neomarinimicrobiota bacterium]MBT4361283.1 tyrosine-type recombinase/integrase [Candidatus Neomarinimicrobiota bacterium]MBT4715045.1 tyrosine-type recombinase/integrase [Candidatus Neomarinimicrobiota bacterium]MBT4944963.1 tyrosine-type recombinase/integrase [Candidatus Neomarinimicrobiota bacterium]MBT5268710.1 tyrosine-type recombinase/integrase [Candidatus Neomarinimicrobiota bacterium]